MTGLLSLMMSCRSDYLSLDYETHHGVCWNHDHTHIAFVASKKAYLSAAGLARFPDGGMPDYLSEDMGLYVWKPEDRHLTRMVLFRKTPPYIKQSGFQKPKQLIWPIFALFSPSPWIFRLSACPNSKRTCCGNMIRISIFPKPIHV